MVLAYRFVWVLFFPLTLARQSSWRSTPWDHRSPRYTRGSPIVPLSVHSGAAFANDPAVMQESDAIWSKVCCYIFVLYILVSIPLFYEVSRLVVAIFLRWSKPAFLLDCWSYSRVFSTGTTMANGSRSVALTVVCDASYNLLACCAPQG
jgi:hypothetical protein